MPRADWQHIGDMQHPMPPVVEQAAISQYLETTNFVVDRGLQGVRKEIGLLEEYRTRLIADVVTGKLDVREAAKALPDDLEEVNA